MKTKDLSRLGDRGGHRSCFLEGDQAARELQQSEVVLILL